jgi:hypothetical protein
MYDISTQIVREGKMHLSEEDEYLRGIPRLTTPQGDRKHNEYRLWLPNGVSAFFDPVRQRVTTSGLGALDKKQKDLIEIVLVEDAFAARFIGTGVLTPRTYAESLEQIPLHVTTQSILLTIPNNNTINEISAMNKKYNYNATFYDNLWIGGDFPDHLSQDDVLMILNRRVGGWDGSMERPVIELLGAGGHVPVIWDAERGSLRTLDPKTTLEKEIGEEIGLSNDEFTLHFIGGFINSLTSELVIIYAAIINWDNVCSIQDAAYGNIDENINGIYIGKYRDVMNMYNGDAAPFAGGNAAKTTNFPSNPRIIAEIEKILSSNISDRLDK